MARKMNKAPSHAWRAVVVWQRTDGDQVTEYLGPYWRRSDAQGRISNSRRGTWCKTFVSGTIESAPLGPWTAEGA